ncbi:hypothetical protein BGZ46_000150 [Entomortierella lignicola]|nr:hypothetical protein BGZ46_000150 [Entomortierella lignicola]
MSNSPQRQPLLLPEIITHVGLLLSRQDLITSLRVCSTWNRSLNPLLWATTLLPEQWKIQKNPTISPSAETLHRNAPYILNLHCWDLFLINNLIPECTRLEKLQVYCLGPQLQTLIEQSQKTLKEIILGRNPYMDAVNASDLVDGLIKALDRCEKLEKVTTKNFIIQQPVVSEDQNEENKLNVVQEFYRAIQKVSTLELQGPSVTEPPTTVLVTPPTFDASFVIRKPLASPYFVPSLPNLRRLVLFGNTMNMLDQVQLLHNCPNLVLLHWQVNNATMMLEDLASDLHFRFLKLERLDLTWSSMLDNDIAAVLSRCPNLTHLRLLKSNPGPRTLAVITGRDLTEEEVGSPINSLLSITDGLRHQLIDLDVTNCFDMNSPDIQRILTRCTKLRSFKASVLETVDITDITTEGGQSWACLDLESLNVSIYTRQGSPPASEPQQQREERERVLEQQRKALAQIGKLTKLKTLSIDQTYLSIIRAREERTLSNLEFSLEAGLDRLSNLRELKVFSAKKIKHKMDCEEYAWIAKHWTNLKELRMRMCPLIRGETMDEDEEEMRVFVQDLMPHVSILAETTSTFLPIDEDEDEDEYA